MITNICHVVIFHKSSACFNNYNGQGNFVFYLADFYNHANNKQPWDMAWFLEHFI